MQAIHHQRYGSAEVVHLTEIAKPTPQDDQLLIKVIAASVNPLDWRKVKAEPFFVRFSEGLSKPKNPLLGADIAGRVEAVGAKITRFKVGDEVFGDISVGGFAEYVCANETQVTHKPAGVSFEQAAATPVAALTALQSLRDHGQLAAGQQVLINGASGGVGSFAVQLAKVYAAEITAVCSSRNVELVTALGADHVVDYTREDVSRSGKRFDLVMDAVGNFNHAAYLRLLKPEGRAIVAGFKSLASMLIQVMILGSFTSKTSKRHITAMLASVKPEDLTTIGSLLAEHKIKSLIDRCYPLAETADAIAYVAKGHARGKVIIQV